MINLSTKLLDFNFDTTCVGVAYITSLQIAYKLNPTSVQVGQKWDFLLPTYLVGSSFFIPNREE